jgi:anti-sigma B factor antagonist
VALRIEEKQIDGISVLDFVGRITLGDESNQVGTKIREILGKGKSQIVLNLEGVSHIDSAGLGALVWGYTSAKNQGATLKLANLTKRFDELLHITKLVTVFDTYGSVDDAVRSFAKTA